ncbi:NEW3 domain-containing protein [Streptomyces lavendulocolor]|uniref:NEW3 domain-containing protein n=1 Tax=Streptomyces lavendulocolor TaxID=67316 RepID=UPI003C2DE6FC
MPCKRSLLVLTAVLATSVGLSPALPASAAGTLVGSATLASAGSVQIQAGFLNIGLDDTGTVVALTDSRTNVDYLASGKSAPLISLVIGGVQHKPTSVTESSTVPGLFTFANAQAGYEVDVRTTARTGYTTLEVTRVSAPTGADVQTVLWGPLPTSITQTVGEVAGLVGNAAFTMGLKPLNDRTEGAWPADYPQYGYASDVNPNPYSLQVADMEPWASAAKTSWGSVLRAFTFDYTKQRLRKNRSGYPIPVGPLGTGGSVVGSKVAVYGISPSLATTVLSEIARGEGLPYPTQNGQWQKAAQASSQSFLVLDDLGTSTMNTAVQYAKSAGINYVYALPTNAVGPWKSTGHYQFDSSFGGSDTTAASAVAAAEAQGVHVGVHTISDFISLNDSYITPTPDQRLAVGQSAKLTRSLNTSATSLYLDSAAPLQAGIYGSVLRVGNEFVKYTGQSQISANEWRVTGLTRGQWGSNPASASTGANVARQIVNGYDGATGGLGIMGEIATRLSGAWNATGIKAMSFDGVESGSDSGWGSYGISRLVNGTYTGTTARDNFISETSRMTTNTWDTLTRASWGEVGFTSMEQVLLNNAFYQANHLPGMLGWINLDSQSLRSVEDNLARGAGLNAGAGFQTSVADLSAGGSQTTQNLSAIKQWETARTLGAFTEAQKAKFRDMSTHWHLSVIQAGQSWSLQQQDASGNPVGAAQTVTVPTPALTTTALNGGVVGTRYADKVTSNTPATVDFKVSSGTLPPGLRPNDDTGGILGTPTATGQYTFTVTATNAYGQPSAQTTYEIGIGSADATKPALSLTSAPVYAVPGGTVTLTVKVTNPGTTAMNGATATISLPAGWSTASPTAQIGSIAAGATATASWTVNLASNVAFGPQSSTVQVAYTGGPGNTPASVTVPVAHPSLAATFDNVAVTNDTNPTPGDFDGYGNSYSAQALAAAGVTPGAALTFNSIGFTWPNAAPGTNNNTRASGQLVPVSGSGAAVAFLGSGVGSSSSGTVTVYYTDGTTSTGTLGFPNWLSDTPTQFGAQTAVTTNYRNTPSGPANQGNAYRVYYNNVTLTAGKTVAAVQLPDNPAIHVFAIGVG